MCTTTLTPPATSVNVAVPVTVEPLLASIEAFAWAGASAPRAATPASQKPVASVAIPIRLFMFVLLARRGMIEDMAVGARPPNADDRLSESVRR
jgi:hypothetical protein